MESLLDKEIMKINDESVNQNQQLIVENPQNSEIFISNSISKQKEKRNFISTSGGRVLTKQDIK